MAVDLTVPQLGESISEAVVGKWHKKVGESVAADEPLVALETDKVTVDVPAPAGGALAQIARKEGDRVKVGEVLGSIAPGGSVPATAPTPMRDGQPAQPVQRSPEPSVAPERNVGDGRGALLTPVARRVAEDNALDPSQLRGSGSGGRIVKDDVLQLLGGNAETPRKAPVEPTSPAPKADGQREERVRMTPLRRRVAERLLQAQSTAAILTTFNEIDMSRVMALRKTYQEKFLEKHGVKLGLMSFFLRASVDALKAFPEVNAEIDGEDVIFKHYYDIGVAVSASRGLVVPVVRDADRLSMVEIER